MATFVIIISIFFLILGLIGSVLPIVPGPPLSFFGLLLLHFFTSLNLEGDYLFYFGAFALIDMAVDCADRLYTNTFGEHSLVVCGEGVIVMDCIEEIFRAIGSYMLRLVVWVGLFWLKVKVKTWGSHTFTAMRI